MEDVAATFGRERLLQQPASVGVARVDELRGHFEVRTRLLVVHVAAPGDSGSSRKALLLSAWQT